MKTPLVLALLFLSFDTRGSPLIQTLGALEEFILRENIRDYEWIANERVRMGSVRRDWQLFKYGSFGWFWSPVFLQKKIKGRMFELGSENNTPVIIMHF